SDAAQQRGARLGDQRRRDEVAVEGLRAGPEARVVAGRERGHGGRVAHPDGRLVAVVALAGRGGARGPGEAQRDRLHRARADTAEDRGRRLVEGRVQARRRRARIAGRADRGQVEAAAQRAAGGGAGGRAERRARRAVAVVHDRERTDAARGEDQLPDLADRRLDAERDLIARREALGERARRRDLPAVGADEHRVARREGGRIAREHLERAGAHARRGRRLDLLVGAVAGQEGRRQRGGGGGGGARREQQARGGDRRREPAAPGAAAASGLEGGGHGDSSVPGRPGEAGRELT